MRCRAEGRRPPYPQKDSLSPLLFRCAAMQPCSRVPWLFSLFVALFTEWTEKKGVLQALERGGKKRSPFRQSAPERKQRKTPSPPKKSKQWPNGFSRQLLFAGTLCGGERSAGRPQKASKREGGGKEIGGVRSINPDFRNFSQIRSPSREERERELEKDVCGVVAKGKDPSPLCSRDCPYRGRSSSSSSSCSSSLLTQRKEEDGGWP